MKSPPLVHAVWVRHLDLASLAKASTLVVKGTVTGTEKAPPITPQEAGAPLDTPAVPRVRVHLRVDEVVWGSAPGEALDVIHAIPPTVSSLPEDPPYLVGDQYLLFLEPSVLGGAWQRVGIDGRLLLEWFGQVRGLLPNGPAPEINDIRTSLGEAIARARP